MLQLDDFTLEHFFGVRAYIIQGFSHKVYSHEVLLGLVLQARVARFAADLGSLPNVPARDIEASVGYYTDQLRGELVC